MSSPDHWNLCLTEGPRLLTRDPTAWLDAQHCAVTGVKRLADVSFPCWTQPGEGVFLSNSSILKLSNSNMLVPFLALHSPSKQMRQYMLLPIWKLHRPAKWRADSYSCSDKLAVLPDHLYTDNFHELLHHWNQTWSGSVFWGPGPGPGPEEKNCQDPDPARTRTRSFAASPRNANVRSQNWEERRSLHQSIHTSLHIDRFK